MLTISKMQAAYIILLSATALLSNAAAESNRFYITAKPALYDAGQKDCESLEFKVAALPLYSELDNLDRYLTDQATSRVWVGARISPTRPECNAKQLFNATCWEWNGLRGPKPMAESNSVTWAEEAYKKYQNELSRAYYDLALGGLDFADNTQTNRALCEKIPAVGMEMPEM